MTQVTLAAAFGGLAFGYGFLSNKLQIFPYSILHAIHLRFVPSVQQSAYAQRTALFDTFPETAEVVMIGDSLTERPDWRAIFPTVSIANRGIAGDTVAGVLSRMDQITATKARKAFIMLGVNELQESEPSTVIVPYIDLVTGLRNSGMAVFVQSTLMTRVPSLNAKITALNAQLRQICDADRLCTYIDLNQRIAPDGVLRPEFAIDSIHINANGYAVWRDVIAPSITASAHK